MQNLFLALVIGTFSITSLSAQVTSLTFRKKTGLNLRGPNCEVLLKQQEAICEWKKNLEANFEIPKLLSGCTKKGKNFSLTISACLPKFTQNYSNQKLFSSGPNCWGTAMSFRQLSKRPRFVWSEEMKYWIKSPLCRKLNSNEQKLPGDILNVYGPENLQEGKEFIPNAGNKLMQALDPAWFLPVDSSNRQGNYTNYHWLLHSEIWLSNEISYGKDSPNKLDLFSFHSMEEVYGRPRSVQENSNCQENQDINPNLREYQASPLLIYNSECRYFTNVYRCENVTDYFNLQDLNPEQQSLWQQIQQLQQTQENLFSLVIKSGFQLDNSKILELTSLTDEVTQKMIQEIALPGHDKMTEMLLVQNYFSAAGIKKSLEQARLIPSSENL